MIHSHGGAICGFKSFLAWDPQRKIGVVVLTNAVISIDDVGLLLVRGLPLTPVSVDPQVLAGYASRYQFSNDVVMAVRVDGTRIFIQVPNQPEYELTAISENRFYPQAFDAEITFYKNANGKVVRLVMSQFGETNEAKRVP